MASEYDALLDAQPTQQKSEYDVLLEEPKQEPSGFQKGLETAQKALGIAQEAYLGAVSGPGAYLHKLAFPEEAKLVQTPLVSPEIVNPIRKAAQYPIQTLNEIVTGEKFNEPLSGLGEFASEQISGQTSPENLALLAVPGIVGKMPLLREIAFGKPPLVPEAPPPIPAEYTERRFTMVDEPKPTYVKPEVPIEETAQVAAEGVPGPTVSPETGFTFYPEETANLEIPSETAKVGGDINATQEGQIPESNIVQHPGDGEGGPPAEAGSSGSNAEGGQATPEVVPETVPQPEQIPHTETPVLEVPEEGGAKASILEERPIEAPEPGEAIGWEEAVSHGENWLNKGGDINKVVTDFRRTGKVNPNDMGKMRAYLQRLQAVTNQAGDALRGKANDPQLQAQYGAALAREQAFTDSYKPMHTVASNTLRSLQGSVPLDEAQAASFTGLTRRFGEFQGKEMTPEQVVKAERISKKAGDSNGQYAKANEELYRKADTEYGRIRTTRKGPTTFEDLGRIFGQKIKEVCET